MKLSLVLLLSFSLVATAFSQKSSWLFDKSVKTTSLLGKGIQDYRSNTKELLKDPMSECNAVSIKLDTLKMDDSYVNEFVQSAKDFYLSFFSTSNSKVSSIKMYNPVEYIVNFESVRKMPNNEYFVFAGQGADSVELIFSMKKDMDVDVEKGADKILSTLNGAGISTKTMSKITPILDSSRYQRNDSLYYKCMLKDPSALFRVQVLKKKNTSFDPSGNDYRLYFPPLEVGANKAVIPDSTVLIYSTQYGRTQPEEPRFSRLARVTNNVAFSLIVGKDTKSKQLKLGVDFVGGPVWFNHLENDGKIFWQDHKLVYGFKANSKIRKLVYVAVYAYKPLDSSDRIVVINKVNSAKVTYMSYPEIKVKYMYN